MFSLEMSKLFTLLSAASCVKSRRVVLSMIIVSRCHIPLTMGCCQYREQFCSLMDRCMVVVGLGHLLGIAVENPIDRSLGRHRLYPLLCERLLDGSGTTAFAMLGQCLAQGHDDLCGALGRFGRGGAGASAPRCAP